MLWIFMEIDNKIEINKCNNIYTGQHMPQYQTNVLKNLYLLYFVYMLGLTLLNTFIVVATETSVFRHKYWKFIFPHITPSACKLLKNTLGTHVCIFVLALKILLHAGQLSQLLTHLFTSNSLARELLTLFIRNIYNHTYTTYKHMLKYLHLHK